MANNAISCLLAKIDAKGLDSEEADRLVKLVEKHSEYFEKTIKNSLEAEMKANSEGLRVFSEQFESKMTRAYTTLKRMDDLDIIAKSEMKVANIERFFNEAFSARKQGFENRLMVPLRAMTEISDTSWFGFNSLNQAENLKILDIVFGKKMHNDPTLIAAADAAKASLENMNAVLKELGGSVAEERGLGTLIVREGLGKTPTKFIDSVLKNADRDLLDDLVMKLPKGMNLISALEAVYKAKKTSITSLLDTATEYGIENPAAFLHMMESHIQFSDPAKWTEFHKEFGQGAKGRIDVSAHVYQKLRYAAEKAATLDHYGESPNVLVDYAAKLSGLDSTKREALRRKWGQHARFSAGHLDHFSNPEWGLEFKVFNKEINIYPKIFMSKMTSAAPLLLLSVVRDVPTTDVAMKLAANQAYGVKGVTRKSITSVLKTAGGIIGAVRNNRYMAQRLGLSVTSMAEMLGHRIRGATESLGAGGFEKIVTHLMRSSGLPQLTEISRIIHTRNFAANIAELIDEGIPFKELPKQFLEALNRNGVSEAEWGLLKHGIVEVDGLRLLSPAKLWESPDRAIRDAGNKFGAMAADIEELGTPTSSIRTQRYKAEMRALGNTQGLLAESMLTFMSYPASVVNNHINRLARERTAAGLGRVASFVVALGTMGIMSEFLNQLRKGEVPTLDEETVMKGLARGSAGGIYGDILFDMFGAKSSYDAIARVTKRLAGVQLVTLLEVGTAITRAAKAEYDELVNDKKHDPKLAADLYKIFRKFAGTSHIYLGVLFDRLVHDKVLSSLDPKYKKKIDKVRKKQEKRGGYFIPTK